MGPGHIIQIIHPPHYLQNSVDRIVAELEKKGNGMRDLIMLVVESNLFLTK